MPDSKTMAMAMNRPSTIPEGPLPPLLLSVPPGVEPLFDVLLVAVPAGVFVAIGVSVATGVSVAVAVAVAVGVAVGEGVGVGVGCKGTIVND